MPRIAVIPGDGVGPEVVEQAMATLDALDLGLDFDVFEHVRAETYLHEGKALSDEDVASIGTGRPILFGAIGDPRIPSPDYARNVLLRLRFELDLYVNHRPVQLLHADLSPLRDPGRRDIDCVIVRENTEGLYAGIGGGLHPGTAHEVAIDTEITTRRGVERVLEYAFAVARTEVCLVDKSNAVPSGGQVWQQCWRAAAARHPDVRTRHLYVDVAAMRLVADPTEFDVIVTNNSYGDILSDLAAQLGGGLGAASSANINPDTGSGLYEPVHGSAPDIAGRGAANPIGAILSAALLAEHLGHREEGAAVRRAVRAAVAAGHRTPDLGGSLTTTQAGEAIRAQL